MRGMSFIFQGVASSAEAARFEDVIQCEQGEADDFLECFNDSLEAFFFICLCAVCIPCCDTVC